VRKVWRQLKREGFDVALCTVSRLMRTMGLQEVIRGKTVKTTVSDKASPYPLDHVNRQFKAPRPNVLDGAPQRVSKWQPGKSESVVRGAHAPPCVVLKCGKHYRSLSPLGHVLNRDSVC
jgi:transposase InsO family protein